MAQISSTQPNVTAVILNTNRRQDTLACLASLADCRYPNFKTIVLDNASTDGSNEAIHATYPQVEILPITENKGYAGNNNVGIAAALERGADWVFVLNEDTILDPDCVGRMVEAGEAAPQIGIVGPLVYHHDEPTIIQSAGGAMDSKLNAWHMGENEPDRGQFQQTRDVDWISGCAIMVHRKVIEDVGVLDERFFYYWEETEWCLRSRRAGWRIVNVPAARLWHKGVQRDYRPPANVSYYNTRNHLLMLQKHSAPLWVRANLWFQIARTLASWTIKPKWRDQRDHRDAMWQGVRDFQMQRWGKRPA
ncbi:MAG: glycosyltransferase family 2 protein [Caldilineaceae bacterium]